MWATKDGLPAACRLQLSPVHSEARGQAKDKDGVIFQVLDTDQKVNFLTPNLLVNGGKLYGEIAARHRVLELIPCLL